MRNKGVVMVIVTVIVRVAGTMARKLPSEASTTELDQLCPLVCPPVPRDVERGRVHDDGDAALAVGGNI